jgi:hypothetical protein
LLILILQALACITLAQPSPAEDGQVLALAPADQKQIEALLGSKVILSALPAQPLLPAAGYLPKNAHQMTFVVQEKGKKARTETHVVATADRQKDGGDLQYEIKSVAREVFDDMGQDKVVTREYDFDKDVVSTFTPGEPLILTGLRPGESRSSQIDVTVADIDKPTSIEFRGKLDVTYTHLGRFRVHVPAGDYDADLIRWTYTGDIGPASVETSQYRFLAENAGMVAMVQWRSISAMLIYHERSRVGKLLSKTE